MNQEFKRGGKPLDKMNIGKNVVLAKIICDKTKDAYSYDAYGEEEWTKIIQYLLKQGFTPFEADMIVKSKLMRWSRDSANKYEGTLRDFIKYDTYGTLGFREKKKPKETQSQQFIRDEINTTERDYYLKQAGYDTSGQLLKEDVMGGVSGPMATPFNVPGMGTAMPASQAATTGNQQAQQSSLGSGDKWGDSSTGITTQVGKPKKIKEGANINPYDKLGVAMAKKMNVKVPFKKKKNSKNQNSMTQTKIGEMKIIPFEEFKELYEDYRVDGITYRMEIGKKQQKFLAGKEGILGYKGHLVSWEDVKNLMKKYNIS